MEILITSFTPIDYGGKGSYILNEIRSLMKMGHKILFVYCFQGWSNILERPFPPEIQDKVRRIRFEPIYGGVIRGPIYILLNSIRFGFFLKYVSQRLKVTVFHAHDPIAALGLLVGGMIQRTVLHVHSPYQKDKFIIGKPLGHLNLRTRFFFLLCHSFDVLLVCLIYNLVRGIICPSEFEYEDVVKRTLSRRKVWLIRNGTDIVEFSPKVVEQEKNPIIPREKFVVLYVGRMVDKNGPMFIVRAAKILKELNGDEVFVFVGDGPEKERIARFVKVHDLTNVIMIPSMPMKDIIHYADVFCSHVSSLVIGHGLTIIEAMSSGIPTITGRDVIKEKIFQHEHDIFFVNKDDPLEIARAIRYLEMNEKLRSEISKNARKTIEDRFDNDYNMRLVERVLFHISVQE